MKAFLTIIITGLVFISSIWTYSAFADSSHAIFSCEPDGWNRGYYSLYVDIIHVSDSGVVTIPGKKFIKNMLTEAECNKMASR